MERLFLVLDDDLDRLAGFREVAHTLGERWEVAAWTDAPSMIAEVEPRLAAADLISLDHDLYKLPTATGDPGTGRDVADYLAEFAPPCPLIIHSTNTDAAWGMYNVLREAGWQVELVHHLNQHGWIRELWLPTALELTRSPPNGDTEPTW